MIGTWSAQQPFFRSGGAPINRVAPAITPDPASASDLLTVSNGTWQFAVSFSYQWFADDSPVGSNVNTFDPSSEGIGAGASISCSVTATSATGRTATASSQKVTLT